MAEVVFTNNISGVIKELDNFIKERMTDACVAVRLNAINSMKEPKTGRVYDTYFYIGANGKLYKIGKRWKPHQASAPGEPPAIDNGELIEHIFIQVNDKGTEGQVGIPENAVSKVSGKQIGKTGICLEYGTSKMKPRPWLKPAFKNSKDKITEIFTKPME
ncbi:MAG: hypothetical protein WC319_12060 [Candidatus Paceibacterota bacterium]|jgi:HK97 gp10 family phage protein